MKKSKKEKKRDEKWNKRICITEEQYTYIKLEMIKRKYRTMAGTLDFIINKYKNGGKLLPKK